MLKNLLKDIFKKKPKDYNDIENLVNIYEICEPGNPYGHVKEFTKLNKQAKHDAHRVLSKESLLLCMNGFIFGTATDISGNTYYFDVFEDGIYRVSKIEKYNDAVMEVLNERNIK